MRNVVVQKAVRKALYSIFGGAAVAALAFAGQVSAADQSQSVQQGSTGAAGAATSSTAAGADVAATALKAVEVTGTRIKRTSVEQAQPIEVVTSAQIKQTGLTNIGDVLQALPSSGSSISTATGNWGNGAAGAAGQTELNLRNLGPQRTLVLVNGHRWITGLDGTVDLNTIPASIIDHIEVLQDGASAIYGSDAMAGVVNIITVKNLAGAKADAYVGLYNGDGHWDGLTKNYDVTVGTSSERSNLLVDVAYRTQGGVSAGSRTISSVPIYGTGNTRGTAATPQGSFKFIAPYGGSTSSPTNFPAASTGLNSTECPASNFGTPSSPLYYPLCYITVTPGTMGTSPSDFERFTQNSFWNYAPAEVLLTPNQSLSLFVDGHYNIADNLTLGIEATAEQRTSQLQSAPDPLGITASTSVTIPDHDTFAYNPFPFALSTQQATGPGLLINISRRMIENGYRMSTQNENLMHVRAGLSGFFDVGNSEWDWDAGLLTSKDYQVNAMTGLFNSNLLKIQLSSPAGCAAQASLGCVPLNLFGGQSNPMTPQQLKYAQYVDRLTYDLREQSVYADITNSNVATLPAGPIGLAFGYQYLGQTGSFQPSAIDMEEPNPPSPTNGKTNLTSIYGEIDIPLLANVPLAKLIDLDIATRRTDAQALTTSNFNTSSRVGLKWQPTDTLLLRATWSQGFRAPSLGDLFQGQTNTGTKAADPCSNYAVSGVPASVQNLCAAQGVPPSYVQSTSQLGAQEEGNPNLKPETSIARTAGFVYSPNWLPGFNMNMDYYKIELEGTIQSTGILNIFNSCYFGNDSADCARIFRYPTGEIRVIDDSVTNIGGTLTSGIDLGLSYSFPVTSVGQFTASLNGSYVRQFNNLFPNFTGQGFTVQKMAGIEQGGILIPLGIPRWKALSNVTWRLGNWSASWKMQYVGPMQESCSDYLDGTVNSFANMGICTQPNMQQNGLSRTRLAATLYHDFQVQYNVTPWNTTLTFGINNAFDKAPPPSVLAVINSYDPTNYRVPGRFFYGSIGVKF